MDPKLWVVRFEGITKKGSLFQAELSLELIATQAAAGCDVNEFLSAELAFYEPISFRPIAFAHVKA